MVDFRRLLNVAALALAVLSLSGCQEYLDPAAFHYAEGEKLAADKKYEDAVKKYEEVATGWPESPQAKMVPAATARVREAVEEVLEAEAQALLKAGDYDGVAQVASKMESGAPKGDLQIAAWFSGRRKNRADNNWLAWYEGEGKAVTGPLGEAITAWTCEHRAEIPTWTACAAVPSDASGVVDITSAMAAIDVCGRVAPLKDVCPAAADDIAKMASVGALTARLTALEAERDKALAADAATFSRRITSAGQAWCSAKASSDAIEYEQAVLAVENRLGDALRMSGRGDAARSRAEEKRGLFSALEDEFKAKPWPEPIKAQVQAVYDAAERKCEQ